MAGSVEGLTFSLLDRFFYGPLLVIFVYLVISWAFGKEEPLSKPQPIPPPEQPALAHEDWGKTFVPSSLLIKPFNKKAIPASDYKTVSHRKITQETEDFYFPLGHSLRQKQSYTPVIDIESYKSKPLAHNNMIAPTWGATQDFSESASSLISEKSLLDLLEGEDEAISPQFRNKQRRVTFGTFKTKLARNGDNTRQLRHELHNTREPENLYDLNFIFNRFSIDDFSKDSFLGQGSAGSVWKVHHKSTGKKYALKVLNSVSKFTTERLEQLEYEILCQSKMQ